MSTDRGCESGDGETTFLDGIDIVDAHHHFLQLDRFPYRWLAPDSGPGRFGSKAGLRRDYLPDHYRGDFSGLPLSASVHIQANCGAEDPVQETRWLQRLSDESGWPTAIVAEADLLAPDAEQSIRRHLKSPALRGIRSPVAWDAAGRWRMARQAQVMADERFRHSLQVLEQLALSLDVVVVPEQFEELADMASAHPGLTIVVNHMGTLEPGQPGNAAAWKAGMTLLQDLPNVHMKLSGLWTVDRDWSPAVLRPYVDHLFDTVGVERVMYGSNLPVEAVNCLLSYQFAQLRVVLADCTGSELEQLFSATARRVYRIAG